MNFNWGAMTGLYPVKYNGSSFVSVSCSLLYLTYSTTICKLISPEAKVCKDAVLVLLKKKTKLHGLSPRANYTDRRLSAKWLPTCADKRCHVSYQTILKLYVNSLLCYYLCVIASHMHYWISPIWMMISIINPHFKVGTNYITFVTSTWLWWVKN
jgi:hypothetical protein